jgi:hypothetical protein
MSLGTTPELSTLTKEQRAVMFEKTFQELMVEYKFTDDERAATLMQQTVKCLREESTSSDVLLQAVLPQFGPIFQSLFSSSQSLEVQSKLQKLREDIAVLETLNGKLSTRVADLETDNARLSSRIDCLEEEKKELNANILAYDLAILYKEYCVEPHLSSYGAKLWREFAPLLKSKLNDLEDTKITEPHFKAWLKPLTDATNIDIVAWQILMRDRHDVAHHPTERVPEQQALLAKAETFNFPASYSHRPMVNAMLDALKTVKLRRM